MSKVCFLKKATNHVVWLLRNVFGFIKYKTRFLECHLLDRVIKSLLVTTTYKVE